MGSFQDDIRAISKDHMHGSTRILDLIVVAILTHHPKEMELQQAFSQLSTLDPNMRIIQHFLKTLKPSIGHHFYSELVNYLHQWEHLKDRLSNFLVPLLPQNATILTHSHSDMTIQVLQELCQRGYAFSIWQTRSRPGGEGLLQAKELKKFVRKVKLIDETHMQGLMDQLDCCIFGMDQYDGVCFVNKVGTNTLVNLATAGQIPVYVLGDPRKKVERIGPINNPLLELIPITEGIQVLTVG